jgi:hypothetical protein
MLDAQPGLSDTGYNPGSPSNIILSEVMLSLNPTISPAASNMAWVAEEMSPGNKLSTTPTCFSSSIQHFSSKTKL